MKVSVIIPTYNEEKVVGECLASLAKQSYRDLEIIVVDDGSRDETSRKLQEAKIPNLQILVQNHAGPGAARNLGAKKAAGEILVFVDADMTFDKDFIEKLVQPIVAPPSPRLRGVKGTFSKEEYVANWDNVWARCWSINQGWEPQRRHPKRYPDKQPVFRAILKSEFEKAGGFDVNRGYDDDWTLSEKLGYQASVAPGAVFYHQNPDNLLEVFEQAKWAAKRKYKLGVFGALYNLLIYSLPGSLWQGFRKSLFKREPLFIIFKVVADFGAFLGILEYLLFKKVAK